MDIDEYRSFLLRTIPTASIASGGRQVTCRCFFCPDSKNPKNKHFYISIPQKENEPSLYYCHKCHSSGLVTYKKLIEWDIYDDHIAQELIKYNQEISKSGALNKYINKIHYNVKSITTTDSDITRYKLDYINKRIGYNFTYEELRNLKIILNLKDIMKDNYITNHTRDARIVDQLDINFLGFLSIDNAFLNMRRICDEGLVIKSIDKRYINYKLYDKYDTSERFYTIPTCVNLNTPNRIKIHIAEGPFDILSVYINLRNKETGIYTSIGGSNYKGVTMYFLEMYKIPNAEIHYYPDNDRFGSTNNIESIANYLKYFNIPIFLHRNTYPDEKDFGVSPDRIREAITQII